MAGGRQSFAVKAADDMLDQRDGEFRSVDLSSDVPAIYAKTTLCCAG